MIRIFIVTLLALWPTLGSAANFTLIGHVDIAQNEAVAHSPSQSRQLSKGSEIFEGEELKTGPDGRLHVTLIDGTSLKLAGNSALTLTEFLLNSPSPTGRLDLGSGTLRLISGKINKLNGGSLEVHSAMAAMAIRGTDFYADQDAESMTLLLNDNGQIDVTGKGALSETRTLDQQGASITVGLSGAVSEQQPAGNEVRRRFENSVAAMPDYSAYLIFATILALYGLVMLSYRRWGR